MSNQIIQSSILNARAEAEMELISHCAFFKNISFGANIDINDLYEICRVIPTKSRIGNLITLEFSIPSDTGICHTAEIVSVSSNQRELTLDDGTYFESSDQLIQIALPTGEIDAEIISKSGDVITLKNPIGTTSASGVLVKEKISLMGIIQSGTSDPNSGALYSIGKAINRHKNETTPPINGNAKFYVMGN